MGYMKEEMIKVRNDKIELYYEIKKHIDSDLDITQKVDSILAKCSDFEYRHPIYNKPL